MQGGFVSCDIVVVGPISWSWPKEGLLGSAARDQTVQVFDICFMKQWVSLRGHKKDVFSPAWRSVYPTLISGGSEGAILHWDLSSPTAHQPQPLLTLQNHTLHPQTQLHSQCPPGKCPARAILSQAHDSNVWALTFHPLGRLLVSASNDHTTHFRAREQPGDAASVFAPGCAKPVAVGPDDDQDENK